jgi:hypothetical protein
MRSSSSNTSIKDPPGDVSSMPSPPEFGAGVSVENQTRRRESPREQEEYGYHQLVVAHHGSPFPSGYERSIPLPMDCKGTVKIQLKIW